MANGFKTGGRVAVYSIMDFTCQTCGKVFHSDKACKSRLPKFCSKECANKSKIIWSICKNCGAQYNTGQDGGKRNKYFCSMKCAADYKRGKPLSEEHKAALSAVKVGKPILHLHTPEVVAKISASLTGKPQPWMRGKLHPNYKNGGVNYYERIQAMGRVEYKNWRREVFARDNYTCQRCNRKGLRIQAHHIKSWSDNPDIRYDVANGITLCIDCHRDIHRSQRKITIANKQRLVKESQ